ncbi:MAG: helix-turn-helix transcriptional regulator [Lachnospiraceae bacterium]|nr:helix-turn-helix transcriptional regulator [Lachnospiraceae bacterium]
MVLIGKRIKELRIKYGLTQTELATQIGVSTATITAYECDSRQPSYDVLIKLAAVFKVTLDNLVLNRSQSVIDVTDLTPEQITRVQVLVDYLRISDIIEILFSKDTIEPYDIDNFIKKYPDVYQNIEAIVKSVMERQKNKEPN